jgi:hypothetical protein
MEFTIVDTRGWLEVVTQQLNNARRWRQNELQVVKDDFRKAELVESLWSFLQAALSKCN